MPNLRIVGIALILSVLPAHAADWQATRVTGVVEQSVNDQWLPLQRDDIVPDGRPVRTLADGQVDLRRDTDLLSLGPATQVAITESTAEPFTTVSQAYGTVEAEVTVQPFEHFEVKTPLLAAVVKGTHFIVQSTGATASVRVTRGTVGVEALETGKTTLVSTDETASIRLGGDLEVATAQQPIPPSLAADTSAAPATDNSAARLATTVAEVGSAEAQAPAPKVEVAVPAPTGTFKLPAALTSAPEGSGVANLLLSYDQPARSVTKPDKDAESMFGPALGAAILCGGILLGGIAILFRRIFG
ncbi:FecR domain-containing protein [Devosia sp.]|uniref:FecR domain-containing protein n=1 Tax=Devosia sp. TaxID=1871048 RepID=UPI003BA9C418